MFATLKVFDVNLEFLYYRINVAI